MKILVTEVLKAGLYIAIYVALLLYYIIKLNLKQGIELISFAYNVLIKYYGCVIILWKSN